MPELRISPEKICFIVVKAREFDAKVAPQELDEGSNPSDDRMTAILEDYADDATLEELRRFLHAQSDEEREDLLALVWLGRGDYTLDDWGEALAAVQSMRHHHIIRYLLGTPLVADFLEEGLSAFGLSCEEFELGRM
jgi:hypothetical protein